MSTQLSDIQFNIKLNNKSLSKKDIYEKTFNRFNSNKKNNRIKKNKKYIENLDKHCKTVKKGKYFLNNYSNRELSKKYLEDVLNNFDKNVCELSDKNIDELKKLELSNSLIPYCCEELKGDKNIDQVNACKLRPNDIKYFKTNYNYTIQPINHEGLKNNLNNDKESIESENDPVKFLEYLLNSKYNTEKKHKVIISHSNFLTMFANVLKQVYSNYLANEYYKENQSEKFKPNNIIDIKKIKNLPNFDNINFDNLDILHLVIDKSEQKPPIVLVSSYRFNDNYKYDDNFTNDDNYEHVFIMRHCIACHNLLDLQPGGKIQKLADLTQFIDSSKYSMCIPQNFQDIISQKDNIIRLFSYYGANDFDKIEFGSSVNFRAVLTSYILQLILSNTTYSKKFIDCIINETLTGNTIIYTFCNKKIDINFIENNIKIYIKYLCNKIIEFCNLLLINKEIIISGSINAIGNKIPKLNLNIEDKTNLKNFIIEVRKIPNNYIDLVDNQNKHGELLNNILNIISNNNQLNLIFVTLFGQGLFPFLNSINDTMEFYKENQTKTYSEYIRFIERNENFINKEDNTIGDENIKRIISENRLENITIFTFNNNTLRIGASRAYIWYNMTKQFISLEKFYIQELLYVAETNKSKGINNVVKILEDMYSDVDVIKNIYNKNVIIFEVIKKTFKDSSNTQSILSSIKPSMKISRPLSMPLQRQLSRQRQSSLPRQSLLPRQSSRRQSSRRQPSSLQRQRSMPSQRERLKTSMLSQTQPLSLKRQISNAFIEASGVKKSLKNKSKKGKKKQKSRKAKN